MMVTYVLDARPATDHFPGIGRYVRALAAHLPAELQEGERLVLLRNPDTDLDASPLSEHVAELRTNAAVFGLGQQWQLPGILTEIEATVYHSPYYLMPYWPRVPAILTVYDLIPLRHPGLVSPRARLVYRWAFARALRTADYVIAISAHTRQDLLARFTMPAERVITVPLAVGAPFAPQTESTVAQVRARYRLPARYVLYFGSNKPHKNLERLINAWQILLNRGAFKDVDIPLIIAGAWDRRYSQPRAQATRLGLQAQVRFLGTIPEADLPGLYAGAQVFVYPSLDEGFGLPVLEAMACGTPVACSKSGSLPEVTGGAARLFDPTLPEDIATALQELLANEGLQATARERGLAQAAAFSWARTARETLRIYRQAQGETR